MVTASCPKQVMTPGATARALFYTNQNAACDPPLQ